MYIFLAFLLEPFVTYTGLDRHMTFEFIKVPDTSCFHK